jgi:hypothetical protein
MFARVLIFIGMIIYLILASPRANAQYLGNSLSVIGEGAAGLFVGDAFGGVTAHVGFLFEEGGMRFTARYVYQVDSRAPDFSSAQPSKIDVMREASILVGLTHFNDLGVYAGSAGVAWTWGRYLPPLSSGSFSTIALAIEGYGGVELTKSIRIGLLARANINGIRTTASINAQIGVVLFNVAHAAG